MEPLSDNERTVLNLVRLHGSMPRAAVAGATKLTQPWVHRLVDQLLSKGLLLASAPRKGTRGQPSVTLSVNVQAAFSIGVALGTDSVDICLADLSCQVIEHKHIEHPASDRDATLATLASYIEQILEKHDIKSQQVVGMGLSIPGFFIENSLQINAPETLREWSLIELAPLVSKAVGIPVTIENNATAAAIGENLIGVGRWARTFCYLDFGYGFGSGLIIDGQPYHGRNGNAGEIIFSVPGVDSARRPALRYLLEVLRINGVQVESLAQLTKTFDPTWPGVSNWLDEVKPSLDQVVNAMAGLFDPDAIVFGGALPPVLGKQLIENTTLWRSQHRYGVAPSEPHLVLAEGGVQTQALGAALAPLWEHFYH
ncbi:ROK family protein [Undibacterium sp. RTI2.2]|uniref:ROK family transcriptional regulator n=1 Tax=unclassified Undibacterium TaxID=2630295 RepID=UPI002B22A1F9|nr:MULTISPECIES: ROK family protein [unclassified Undibacterium]MEB0116996.1 ROK family protein [Undibacterium sp. RTI2.2]MEB0229926.1 ROK family protein [Undibacterium sp. 10I3]